jgi:hypothetical protein
MNYLLSEAAMCRYVIAAHYLQPCPEVVEIGGFKTPITRFLTHSPGRVLVVDPLIEPFVSDERYGQPCRVEHVRNTFQTYNFQLEAGNYGLVLLGASTKYFSDQPVARESEWQKLRGLVARSKIAVLEHPVEWPLGREIVTRLLAEIEHELVVSIDLDMSQNPDVVTEHFLRRLQVIKPHHTQRTLTGENMAAVAAI